MLLSLTPGVIFTQEQFGASGFSGTRGWDVNNSYKFNGARAGNGNNVFMLNGTPISNEGSTWEFAPSVDAVQEFSAMTTVYDAQYGHEAGGVVNTVIRGGANNFHGTVYDYFRNAVLDANNFGNNVAGAKKGAHQQNQFGGTFGGPIRKDKDFVFVSYEGWQEVIPFPGSGVLAIPLDMRDGQHFTKYNMQIFDPLTTRVRRHRDRTVHRHQRFDVLALSVPGQRDSAEPDQPDRHQDPELSARAEFSLPGHGRLGQQRPQPFQHGPLLVQPADRALRSHLRRQG